MGEASNDSFREWIPAGWPARSLAECEAILCAPGARFEYETIAIRGVPTRVWKNAPANLAALVKAGRAHGDATFMIYEDERVSYEAWFRAVAALGRHLQSLGVQKGDRVALAMRNLPEWPVVFFAAVTIGAICVPLNAWWTGPELAYGLAHSGAKVLVCDGERLDRIAPHREELPDLAHVIASRRADVPAGVVTLDSVIGPSAAWASLPDQDLPEVAIAADDDATILYTSGTTGNPKGALGTHRNFVTNIFSSAYGAARQVLAECADHPLRRRIVLAAIAGRTQRIKLGTAQTRHFFPISSEWGKVNWRSGSAQDPLLKDSSGLLCLRNARVRHYEVRTEKHDLTADIAPLRGVFKTISFFIDQLIHRTDFVCVVIRNYPMPLETICHSAALADSASKRVRTIAMCSRSTYS